MNREHEFVIDKECKKVVESIGKSIYHYTSSYVLFNIMNTNELWLGNTANMNDKSELSNFIDLIEKELRSKHNDKQKEIDNIFYEIRDRLKKEYPFVLCFSKDIDDAAQWERYGDHAQGICVEFDTYLLTKYIYKAGFLSITNIFYDDNVKNHAYTKCFSNYLDNKPYEFENLKGLIDNLLLGSAGHKHKSFKSENECRLYTFYETETEHSKTEYKIFNSNIKKVLVLDLNKIDNFSDIKFYDTISKIIVGPKSTQNINDLKDFIKDKGYPDLSEKIVLSECPLR